MKQFIKSADRKTTILKAGWYTLNGLLVEIKQDAAVVYAEEESIPAYMIQYNQNSIVHSHNGGQGRFSTFKTMGN